MEKVAIVTGAGRGIGKCLAHGLAVDGYGVALLARSIPELAETRKEISDSVPNSRLLTLQTDVSDPQSVASAMDEIIGSWKRVDVLVNNAGTHALGTLELTNDDFERLMEVNLFGALNCVRSVLPTMKAQGSGAVINISSVCGIHGFAGVGGYTASKFALMGLSESLYRELLPLGIKVTAICPSWVDTAMAWRSPVPRDKMIRPDDILRTVRYVLSLSGNAAVAQITVQCVPTPL